MKTIILASTLSILLISCTTRKSNIQTSTLIDKFCLTGPKSCIEEKVEVEGYLDGINIYDNKLFLWASPKSINDKNNRFIEVYFPQSELTKYFTKTNDHYSCNFEVKVIIHNAEIKSNQIATTKVSTINYLTVERIEQIEFFKIEKGKLRKL